MRQSSFFVVPCRPSGVIVPATWALLCCFPPETSLVSFRVAYAQKQSAYAVSLDTNAVHVDVMPASRTFPLHRLRQATGRLLPVFIEGRLGFIDRQGKLVVKPAYDRLGIYGDSWRLELTMGEDMPTDLPRAVDVIPFADWFDGFHDGICIVARNGKLGFLRDDGELVVPCRYRMVTQFHKGIAFGMAGSTPVRIDMINHKGEVLRSDLEAIAPVREGRVGVRIDGRWGFLNYLGEAVIEPQYESIGKENRKFKAGGDAYFADGVVQVWKNGLTGIIDRCGKTIVPIKYAAVRRCAFGFEAIEAGQERSVYDWSGHRIPHAAMHMESQSNHVELNIEAAHVVKVGALHEGLVPFQIASGKWGYATWKGKVAIEPRFHRVGRFRSGCAAVTVDGNCWGIIGQSGEYSAEPRYDKLMHLSQEEPADQDFNALFKASWGGLWGVIDRQGNTIVANRFRWLGFHLPLEFIASNRIIARSRPIPLVPPHKNEFYGVLPNGTVAVLDRSGRYLVRPRYIEVDWLIEGYRRFVTQDGKWGFLDAQGRVAIPARFDFAEPFHNGIALVGMDAYWGIGGTNDAARWGYIRVDGSFLWRPSH